MTTKLTQLTLLAILTLLGALSACSTPVTLSYQAPVSTFSAADADAYFAQMKAAGVQRVRIQATWTRIQPTAKQWEFAWLDALIAKAQQQNLAVVLVFGPSPRWTVTYLKNPTAAELRRARPDKAAYSAYVTAVAKRYQNRVRFYQAWERPSAATLLANQSDIDALYGVAARAVHGVNPALKLVVAEPGDIDLGWARDFFARATGASRPDVVLLSPMSFALAPQVLWHRISVLRDKALTGSNPPALWLEAPVTLPNPTAGFNAAAAGLLADISDLWLSQSDGVATLRNAQVQAGLKALATLQGNDYRGWARPTGDVTLGLFATRSAAPRALVVPNGAEQVMVAPADDATASDLIADAQTVDVLPVGDAASRANIARRTGVPVSQATIITGVSAQVQPGGAGVDIHDVAEDIVSLSLNTTTLGAIRPIPNQSCGNYRIWAIDNTTRALATEPEVNPWIYLDVPDGFMFFNTQRTPVTVTVTVVGAPETERNGFNFYYDSITGMKYTAWQWIDVGPNRTFTYTLELDDALFSNRNGYDLRFNAGGSKDRVKLVNLTISK